MPNVRQLSTRAMLESRKASGHVLAQQQQLFDELGDQLPPDVRRTIVVSMRAARRAARDDEERIWAGGFNMISRRRYLEICRQLVKLPAKEHRKDATLVFMFLVGLIEKDTAEISWNREEFAAELGVTPRQISSAMTTLERLGAVRRERDGRGVTYYVQADVAWNGDMDLRKEHLTKATPSHLRVVEASEA